jgi:hypothetical protein
MEWQLYTANTSCTCVCGTVFVFSAIRTQPLFAAFTSVGEVDRLTLWLNSATSPALLVAVPRNSDPSIATLAHVSLTMQHS